MTTTHFGFVALVGRPNVGKSTLLNAVLGQKVSITAPKAQTTRQRVRGVKTVGEYQTVYVDTPGFHRGEQRELNRVMNRSVVQTLRDVDLVVLLVEAKQWTKADDLILEKVKRAKCPVILAINKIDHCQDKIELLPFIDKIKSKHDFAEVVMVAALIRENIDQFEQVVQGYLPEEHHYFPSDQITDVSEQFLAAEIIREKLTRCLEQELPYSISVAIEQFQYEDKLLRISALICVEREGQKRIVIGKKGDQLRKIGTQARCDLERLFQCKVFLNLWVKVKPGWADNKRILGELGYLNKE